TGITRYNQGMDAKSLNKTASGISQIMTSSQGRMELVSRVFANDLVAGIFKLILWCECKYQDTARVIRLRGNWVPMDPQEWDEQMDLIPNVGLGTGNRDQMISHLQLLGQAQELIVQGQGGFGGPVVTPENIYNLSAELSKNAGFKNP